MYSFSTNIFWLLTMSQTVLNPGSTKPKRYFPWGTCYLVRKTATYRNNERHTQKDSTETVGVEKRHLGCILKDDKKILIKWKAVRSEKNEKRLQDTQKTVKKNSNSKSFPISITLNVNSLNLQSKDIDWLNGFKKKKKLKQAIYKKLILYLRTHRLKVKK